MEEKKQTPVQMEQSPFIQNWGCQMDRNVLWFFYMIALEIQI